MATVSRSLPPQPCLDVPKREARELLDAFRAAQPEALDRVRGNHPRYRNADEAALKSAPLKLSDAQLVLAREYGFSNWMDLRSRILSNSEAHALDRAIRNRHVDTVEQLLRQTPALLHLPVRSGNWGPPMSHAANFGYLEVVQKIASLGAKDVQHAFDRALLQGRIDCARWLHDQGAELAPGIVMGACETLNPHGLRFLAELGAPFTNREGDRLAPLALALETYTRNREGKHAILDILAAQGYQLPDTPIMAFHRGDVAALDRHLRRDPSLVSHRFSLGKIYPPEAGCASGGRSGMHGTPLDGTTLLHLAIDFDEQEVFDLLLARGADVNARASVDAEGFGGHTPLFVALVNSAVSCGLQGDASMGRELIRRGASMGDRANVRKFLDWQDEPCWHTAIDVTAVEWARGFPLRNWVNEVLLQSIEGG